MKQSIHKKLQCWLLYIIIELNIPAVHATEVIVNIQNTNRIHSINDLQSIFVMRKRYWDNGEKINVFVLPDNNDMHKAFVKEKLLMFPHQIRKIWDKMTYTGTGQAPIIVQSIAEMLNQIKQNPNAIGYINNRETYDSIRFLNIK